MKFTIFFLSFLMGSNLSLATDWTKEDLSFEFESKLNPAQGKVLRDEWIRLAPFETPGQEKPVSLTQYRLIFGENSLAIFDAYQVNEVAGLLRKDAEIKISQLEEQGKSERDGAFIAGLTNIHGREIFMFFNVSRMKSSEGYALRLAAHEPLHLARFLITTFFNPNIDYLNDPYVKLDDDNEEFFGETTERAAAIVWDRYQRFFKNGTQLNSN